MSRSLSFSQITKHHRKIVYTTFILFVFANLFFLLGLLIYTDNQAEKQLSAKSVIPKDLPVPSPVDYPIFNSIQQPDITAQAAIILDNDSKVVLYYKNMNEVSPMASSTKIMTALVALDYYQKSNILVDKTYPVDGSIAGLRLGEKMSFENALYGLLLPSGNDVAIMLAQNYPGGMPAFITAMNDKAKKLHMSNTYYNDVDGLSEENVTTAYDMALLASEAIKNPFFKQVVGTKKIMITDVTGKQKHTLSNLNKLLGTEGVTGIKTGFTDAAGGVLVTSKEESGHTFIIVVLKSNDRFVDTQKLLQLMNGNITFEHFGLDKG